MGSLSRLDLDSAARGVGGVYGVGGWGRKQGE